MGDDVLDCHYSCAHEAAQSICPGVYQLIPVDVHDLVHESALAGYAAALSDLEKGKLDDRIRARSELLD